MKTSATRRRGALQWEPVMCRRAAKKTPESERQSQKKYSRRKLAQARSGWLFKVTMKEANPTAIKTSQSPLIFPGIENFFGAETAASIITPFLPSNPFSEAQCPPESAARPVEGRGRSE